MIEPRPKNAERPNGTAIFVGDQIFGILPAPSVKIHIPFVVANQFTGRSAKKSSLHLGNSFNQFPQSFLSKRFFKTIFIIVSRLRVDRKNDWIEADEIIFGNVVPKRIKEFMRDRFCGGCHFRIAFRVELQKILISAAVLNEKSGADAFYLTL